MSGTTCPRCRETVAALIEGSDLCIDCDSLSVRIAPPWQPSYADQVVNVLAATEGHEDPAVRAARKVVANALVALDRTLNRRPVAVPSARDLRAWAVSQGLAVPSRGRVPARIADAWVAAQSPTAVAS